MSIFRKQPPARRPFCTALVPAAGNATRMGGPNKLLMELCGIPVLGRALLCLEQCPGIDEIIIAARPDDIVTYGDIVHDFGIRKVIKIVRGGENRLRSVYNAALECSKQTDLLAVHDGARPFATPALIDRLIETAARTGSAAPCLPLTDTVKQVDGDVITGTVDRSVLRAVQTPQVFDAALLRGALYKALSETPDITDDCAAVEALGMQISLVAGEAGNIKITTPDDLAFARVWLSAQSDLS